MTIQYPRLGRTGFRVSRLAAPKSRRQGFEHQPAHPGANGRHPYALKIKLTPEIFDALDAIWPGPRGEAPEAYTW